MFERQGMINKDDELDLLSEEESPRGSKREKKSLAPPAEDPLSQTQRVESEKLQIKEEKEEKKSKRNEVKEEPKEDFKEEMNPRDLVESTGHQPSDKQKVRQEDFNKTMPIPQQPPMKSNTLNDNAERGAPV